MRCRLAREDLLASSTEGPDANDETGDEAADVAPAPLAAGTVLGDRYVILELHRKGGMAHVYRARDLKLAGTVHAIKVLYLSSAELGVRLAKEGVVQAQLRSAHVVAVTDVVDVGGRQALVMEFVEGGSLAGLLRRGRPTPEQIDRLAEGLFSGLAAVHRAKLVHRDLKPDNVLVAVDGEGRLVPKIADFGLVKIRDEGGDQTRTGVMMGTYRYMSPEQMRETKSVDARSDLFALGAVLYELVTGRFAFDGTDRVEIILAVSRGRYRPVREVAPDAPARWVAAIDAALKVLPDERAQTVEELAARWRGEVDARPPAPPSTRPSWWLAAGVAAAALLAVAGVWATRPPPATTQVIPSDLLVVDGVVEPPPEPPLPTCPPLAGPLMPMAVGNRWLYRVTDPETMRFLFDKDNRLTTFAPVPGLDGVQAYGQDRRDGPYGGGHRWLQDQGAAAVWVSDDWLDEKGKLTKSETFDPGRLRVDWSCARRTAGAKWTEKYRSIEAIPGEALKDWVQHEVQWTVEAVDVELTVPAGTFCTIQYRRKDTRMDTLESVDQTYWFAPGIGKIQERSSKEFEQLLEFHLVREPGESVPLTAGTPCPKPGPE